MKNQNLVTKPHQRAAENQPANALHQLAPSLDPSIWTLRVLNESGTLDEYIAFPLDADYVRAIRDRFGVGHYRVRLVRRAGRSVRAERERLGIGSKRPFEAVTVPAVSGGTPPAEAETFAGETERQVENAGEGIHEPVQRELREAARIEAECHRIEAEAKLKKLKLGLSDPKHAGDPFAVVLEQQAAMFRELLRASEAREARLLQEMAQLRQAPQNASAVGSLPAQGLGSLKDTLGLLREVLSVADQFRGDAVAESGDDDSAAGGIVRVMREAKGLLSMMPVAPARAPAPAPGRQAAPGPRPMPQNGAAPKRISTPANLARQRVESFLAQLVEEATLGSSPDAVANALDESIGLLPASVREPLDEGNWRAAWSACAQILGGEKWNELDASLQQSTEVQLWLEAFAASCQQEPEEPEERKNAEG